MIKVAANPHGSQLAGTGRACGVSPGITLLRGSHGSPSRDLVFSLGIQPRGHRAGPLRFTTDGSPRSEDGRDLT